MALIPAPAGLFISSDDPTDQRWQVKNIGERDAMKNTVAWEGMITYVEDEDKWYRLKKGKVWEEWTMGTTVDLSSIENRLDTLEADKNLIYTYVSGYGNVELKLDSVGTLRYIYENTCNYGFPATTPQTNQIMMAVGIGALGFRPITDALSGVDLTPYVTFPDPPDPPDIPVPNQLVPNNSLAWHTDDFYPSDGTFRYGFGMGYVVDRNNNTLPSTRWHTVWTGQATSGRGFQFAVPDTGKSLHWRDNQGGWNDWRQLTEVRLVENLSIRIDNLGDQLLSFPGIELTPTVLGVSDIHSIISVHQAVDPHDPAYFADFNIKAIVKNSSTSWWVILESGWSIVSGGKTVEINVTFTKA